MSFHWGVLFPPSRDHSSPALLPAKSSFSQEHASYSLCSYCVMQSFSSVEWASNVSPLMVRGRNWAQTRSGAHISHQRLETRSWGFYSLKMRRYWPQYLFTLVCSSCFMQITLFAEFLDISRLMFQLHLPILLFTSPPLLASIHTRHYTTQFVDVNQNSRLHWLQLHLVQ